MNQAAIFAHLLKPTLLGVASFIVVGYLLSRILKRNDIADFLWGLGFVVIAIFNFDSTEALTFRGKASLAFIILWGLRLSIHLASRIFVKKTEDPRYVAWRKDWGKNEPLMAFLKVFVTQGFMMAIISLPVAWAIQAPDFSPDSVISPWDFLGAAIFLIGFIFEATADAQLKVFKKRYQNHGKVMTEGVWAFSRHPNYFGEALMWWGLFFLCLPSGIVTIVSPLTITFLLVRVTGVPMLEKGMASKGAEFKTYVKETPAFLPFRLRNIFSLIVIAATLCLLDFVWLNLIFGDFYRRQGANILRLVGNQIDFIPWATIGVYFAIALGIRIFAVRTTKLDSAFRGAFFGLCTYAIYDLTNVALVSGWPLKMAFIDIVWGPFLCAVAACIGCSLTAKNHSAPSHQ